MITGAIITLLSNLAAAILGLLPHFAVPSFIATAGSYVATVTGYAVQLGNWVPWTVAVTGVLCVLGAIAVAWAVKGVRMVLSLMTFGGGSAA